MATSVTHEADEGNEGDYYAGKVHMKFDIGPRADSEDAHTFAKNIIANITDPNTGSLMDGLGFRRRAGEIKDYYGNVIGAWMIED